MLSCTTTSMLMLQDWCCLHSQTWSARTLRPLHEKIIFIFALQTSQKKLSNRWVAEWNGKGELNMEYKEKNCRRRSLLQTKQKMSMLQNHPKPLCPQWKHMKSGWIVCRRKPAVQRSTSIRRPLYQLFFQDVLMHSDIDLEWMFKISFAYDIVNVSMP